jgi:uncharacterized protein YbaP (TraB family)
MPILELESTEYQFQILSSIPDDLIIESLQEDLDYYSAGEDFEELFTTWEEGDYLKMESLVFGSLDQNPELSLFYETVFDKRNITMAEKIEGYLENDETYFVVVGAGHLVGDNGLVNLLGKKGYSIRQLEDLD